MTDTMAAEARRAITKSELRTVTRAWRPTSAETCASRERGLFRLPYWRCAKAPVSSSGGAAATAAIAAACAAARLEAAQAAASAGVVTATVARFAASPPPPAPAVAAASSDVGTNIARATTSQSARSLKWRGHGLGSE